MGGKKEIAGLDLQKLSAACKVLAKSDTMLASVHKDHGVPPLWERPQGFATLLHIILEQQVSLASAKACFDKLAVRVGEVTPQTLLALSDDELRAVGFSRQKAAYARHLSESILGAHIDLESFNYLPDDEIRTELTKLKGIGNWTADIYLLMAMLRPDVMPKGDLALHVAYQKLTGGDRRPTSDEFITLAEKWKPYRSVAARLLWNYYLAQRRKPA